VIRGRPWHVRARRSRPGWHRRPWARTGLEPRRDEERKGAEAEAAGAEAPLERLEQLEQIKLPISPMTPQQPHSVSAEPDVDGPW
jgi:hypothetical protein